MIPRELLKKIRQIELRSTRLVTDSVAGQYHSVFKGQGMNFDEVREYQPGDDVRSIDWNVTARMNHPFIKKFVEERELTLVLMVDVSASGLFGSAASSQSKRELAAEIASVLAFSAIRNNDKVGLILYSDQVEKFIPPRKGKRHVLRVVREILGAEPAHPGTDLAAALQFLSRVITRRAIAVILSDFIGPAFPSRILPSAVSSRFPSIQPPLFTALRQANRKHDVVAMHIVDRFETELPALGRLLLTDAETGETVEIDSGDPRRREIFAGRQRDSQRELVQMFRSARIDSIRIQTDEPYATALAKFFESRERRRPHH